MVDLGLPSGTKWACCNVGASSPEEYGNYYAWGETETKEIYNWSTYIHCDGSGETCYEIGHDIQGTQYDVARVKWGGEWMMPTRTQIQELLDNCTHEWTTMNGVNGRRFTGPNGDNIFLPAAGARNEGSLLSAGKSGCYWSSSRLNSDYMCAEELGFNSAYAWGGDSYTRNNGRSVRPVR